MKNQRDQAQNPKSLYHMANWLTLVNVATLGCCKYQVNIAEIKGGSLTATLEGEIKSTQFVEDI